MKIKENRIPINLWDDYCEDEGGRTYAYIESDDFTDSDRNQIAAMLYGSIMALKPECKVELAGGTVEFENLTHTIREKLVQDLTGIGLKWKGKPVEVYSES